MNVCKCISSQVGIGRSMHAYTLARMHMLRYVCMHVCTDGWMGWAGCLGA